MNLPATSPEKPGGKASYHNGTQHLPIINLFPFTIPILSFRMEHYVAKIEGREKFKSFPYKEGFDLPLSSLAM